MKITQCPISGTTKSTEYLNLGSVPLVNNLCLTREESLSCTKYPLAIQRFQESNLTCLTEVVNKDDLFLNYLYSSGVNKPYLIHCAKMYGYLASHITLSAENSFSALRLIGDYEIKTKTMFKGEAIA